MFVIDCFFFPVVFQELYPHNQMSDNKRVLFNFITYGLANPLDTKKNI